MERIIKKHLYCNKKVFCDNFQVVFEPVNEVRGNGGYNENRIAFIHALSKLDR